MKCGIIFKKNKVKDESVVYSLKNELEKKGHCVEILTNYKEIFNLDVVIILGGDGAILHSAIPASFSGVKLIGINYGNVGFLTEFEAEDTLKVVDLLDSNYSILKRTILEIQVDDKKFYALNEATIQRNYALPYADQVVKVSLFLNDEKVSDYAGDGIIVSTPTGSTAYSLSAGGNILSPTVPAFLVTPICSFLLKSRPIVFSDNEILSFYLSKQKNAMNLFADGKFICSVDKNSKITIKKSNYTADFITEDKNKFFQKLENKFNK